MAIRLNTVEYAFPQVNASVNGGVSQQFTQITMTIPETTNRTFVSAFADIATLDAGTAATSPTSRSFDLRVGGSGAYQKNIVTQTITNSGENMSYHFIVDVSNQFVSKFTGQTQVIDASFALAVQSSNNTTCKLVVTYQWDDADQWRVKTVRIPIESSTGALGRLPANIMGPGLKNVPALDSFLPEASISYKDIFFESWVNESTNAAATPLWPRLYFSLDGEASSNDIGHQNTLISSRLYRRIWRRLDMSTNIEHEFKASTDTSLNMGFYCMPAVLNVTYTYWEPSTLRVLNSVVLAAADEVGFPGATTSTSASRFKRQLNIPEANPVLVRSGVLFSFIENATAAVNFNVKVGAQSAYTTYRTMPPGLVVCGGFFFMHNFDASSRAGQGIALSPTGSFFVDWYTGSLVYWFLFG